MYRKIICSLAVIAASTAIPALALTASQTIEREVVVRNADGTEAVKRESADKVTPGDKVIYSLNYFNDEAEAASNIVLVMPVPAEIKYLDGSADMQAAQTTYSVDAGQSFANRDDLLIKLEDGSTRSANAKDITHIRWLVTSPVAPNSGGTLSFSGRLK